MHMLYRLRIALCSLAVCLLLSACHEEALYPSNATQEITLLRSGEGTIRYTGTFRDAYPELTKFMKKIERLKGK
jgi:hypothetical protein